MFRSLDAERVVAMLLNLYAVGWLATTIGMLFAAAKIPSCREVRLSCVVSIAVTAGALWPALILGSVEIIAIAAVTKMFVAVPADDAERERHPVA